MLKVFSIFDAKAGAFLLPFFAPNGAVASRMVEYAVNDKNHDFHKFAADYTLFEIGSFDDASGRLIEADKLVSFGVLITFLKGDNCGAV